MVETLTGAYFVNPKRDTVRLENPIERQGGRPDESTFRTWRPVCDSSDSGAGYTDTGSRAKAS